jgi:hypothetical protein
MNRFCSNGPQNGQNECIYIGIVRGDDARENMRIPCASLTHSMRYTRDGRDAGNCQDSDAC